MSGESTPQALVTNMLEELQDRFLAAGNIGASNALIVFEREVAAGLEPFGYESKIEAVHDALAIMRRAADVLAEYPEHETLTQSLRGSCRRVFETFAHWLVADALLSKAEGAS